ncbi:MAG: anaerobic ribonucleoside-triphosphate reductase activating protein [Candidatus Pseudobacter hemicellulosilyticus]|uniref:Anaerobic ribonucleoside-triphosphate reductase activating protein n=1 Tax=Candidatus Pseudobacter hemicellulosilyticus TaxID=3121375 RepID=A0AAJ5WN60_9BACT|nr:MAG: anaerobic ribonucleoside-triphosphate reductase activating protein [Pseudobacter sp.]
MANPVYSITPFTMLDFPGHTACIIWFAGCNMRCAYCYNPDIVLGKGQLSYRAVLDFLDKRRGLLDGVVLSGGECTLHKGLPGLAATIKEKGFRLKIDTNGANPALLEQLISHKLVDYVALDCKAPAAKYGTVTGINGFREFEDSLHLLLASGMPFEVRTTVHSALLNQGDVAAIQALLEERRYPGKYYIQYALNDTTMLKELPANSGRLDLAALTGRVPVVERN